MNNQNTDKGFKNHQEMWEHLLNGGRICLCSDKNVRAKMENGSVISPYNIGAPAFWMPYEEPKWHENIPEQGILCRVADRPEDKGKVKRVVRYAANNKFKYQDDYLTYWKLAEPLTYQEAIDLIYKPLDT